MASLTLSDFIAATGMKMETLRVSSNPNWTGDRHARHFQCSLSIPGHGSMLIRFSQGSAIKGEPRLEDVLYCLSSDASGIENNGYDTDSRSAEKTFKAVEAQTIVLQQFLAGVTVGDDEEDAYNVLLWDTQED